MGGFAFKEMLTHPVPNVIKGSDQAWYQRYIYDNRDKVHLDVRCELVCSILSLEPQDDAVFQDGRISIPSTKSQPLIVHFNGYSHGTQWDSPSQGGKATSPLQSVFRTLYPEASSILLDKWYMGLQVSSTHDIVLYEGPGFWKSMHWVLCFYCLVLGARQNECHY